MTQHQEQSLLEKLLQGPDYQAGEAVFNGHSIRDFIEENFNVCYQISSIYDLLKRLGCKKIKPRPRHKKNDLSIMLEWQLSTLPQRVQEVMQNCPGVTLEFWFQDECRYGEKGGIKGEWKPAGATWTQPTPTGFRNAYIYGAVCPSTGKKIGYVADGCNTDFMTIHLSLISQGIEAGKHAIVIMDNAAWHSNAKSLVIPDNITIVDLPPYSPELNPIERVWKIAKERYLTSGHVHGCENLLELGCEVWSKISEEMIKSLCQVSYLGAYTNFS